MTVQLKEEGVECSENRVARLMAESDLKVIGPQMRCQSSVEFASRQDSINLCWAQVAQPLFWRQARILQGRLAAKGVKGSGDLARFPLTPLAVGLRWRRACRQQGCRIRSWG